jgi:hypothetical protein
MFVLQNQWFRTFPGVVAGVTAGDVISGGIFTSHNGLIQLVSVMFDVLVHV